MGRCNNRRAQQAAAELRNTPSRARFSKPPPSKKRGGRGRGSSNTNGRSGGRDNGRGGGRGGRGGRGGGGNSATRSSVIDKLSKRVEDKTKQNGVSSSQNTSSRKNPLAGLDISKLDEVTLSEESVQLVTKLLTDLNVMESNISSQNLQQEKKRTEIETSTNDDEVMTQNTSSTCIEETNDESVTSGSGQSSNSTRVSGYTEYDDDVADHIADEFSDKFHLNAEDTTIWEGNNEKNDGDDEESDGESSGMYDDNKKEQEAENDDDDAIMKTPLFVHLTTQLSFSKQHAKKACLAIQNWSILSDDQDSKIKEKSAADELGLAMDWLCLHLTEEELKQGFKPNSMRTKQQASSTKSGVILVGTGRTKAIPHPSISIAMPITSDQEWRETMKRQSRMVGFVRLGFHHNEAERACIETKDVEICANPADDNETIQILLQSLEEEVLDQQRLPPSDTPTSADLEYAESEREQEIEALEAIYDDQFQKITSNYGKAQPDRYLVSIQPNEDLEQPARSAACKLHVLVRPGYPVMVPPLLLFTNPTLPPTLLRRINIALIREVHQSIGEPIIFTLVDYLCTNLHDMQKTFIKEQRAKEFEAEQLRLRKDAGHDMGVDSAIEAQYEIDGKIGRRQKARLRAAEKAYDRGEQLEKANQERQLRQDEHRERIRKERQLHRHTRAERVLQQRAKERIEEEAERAARAAMNAAFNRGESADKAREAAKSARKQNLRDNGEDVSSDEEHVTKETGINEETKEETKEEINEETNEETKEENGSVKNNTEEGEERKEEKKNTASAQTTAFMERLRQFYNDAASEKRKGPDTNAASSDRNLDEKKDANDDRFIYSLAEPKIQETPDTAVSKHVPAPVAVPCGDLGKMMKGLVKEQSEQPWLVSEAEEARVLTSEGNNENLTPEQLAKQKKVNTTLRDDLKRMYHLAEKARIKNGGTNQSKRSDRSGQQFFNMLSQRKKLPAYLMKEEIVQTIASNQITVISGDTGCGKTTQVPQLVLDDLIWNGNGASANIIVTQPRRISAIGVAERIASERCESVGETTGYSIRLENKRSSKTRLLLCTTGILLRRLQCDPDLASVSHVFVDEVHERDINTDFLLIILRDLLARRKSLRLVLMSATLNAETFSAYFSGCPTVSIPGRTHPVKEHRLEDILAITGYEVEEGSDYAKKSTPDKPPRFSKSALRKLYYPKYDTKVISSLAIADENVINYELIAKLLEHITLNEEPGAILVFLPGMMEITKAIEELYKTEVFTDPKRTVIYPLHSSLSTSEQTAVFDVPKEGIRKVVVATNIAETSITIEDVVYVIDAGRVKENRQDEVNQMPALVECWVSRASAKQRRGRAGRVRPGYSYHLYSSHTFEHDLQEYQLPEMLRVGLEDLVLQILLLDLGEPSSFLYKAVNPPSALAMRNSLKLLEGLGAVECEWGDDGARRKQEAAIGTVDSSSATNDTLQVASGLTALGFHLATLPVDPRVGKMMIYGALFGCIDPALTIAASMSARNPFMSPFDKRDEADAARKEFATENSDHLTTLTAFTRWKEIRRQKGNGAAQGFLRDSFLSRLTLFQMEDLRKQFADNLVDIGFLPKTFKLPRDNGRGRNNIQGYSNGVTSVAGANSGNIHLIKAVLCAGLYPNIIVAPRPLVPKDGRPSEKAAGECAFASLKGDAYLHPSTISFSAKKLDSRYCCYHEIVKTSKNYVRDATPVSEFALLLFGGKLKVYHTHGVVSVDDWLKFRIAAKPATLVKHLRAQMESMLLKKIVNPEEDVTGSPEGKALIQAVSTLLEREVKTIPDGADIVRPWKPDNDGNNNNGGRSGRSQGGRGRGRGRGRGPTSQNSRSHGRGSGRGGRGRY